MRIRFFFASIGSEFRPVFFHYVRIQIRSLALQPLNGQISLSRKRGHQREKAEPHG